MSATKVDLLVFAAHPDDAELSCSGIILKTLAEGKSVALIDLTEGELGTRGSVIERYKEASDAMRILGVAHRENLQLRDGFFEINETSLLKVIEAIRKYQPEIILCNAPSDRHPDHGRAGDLIERAHFLSGLRKINNKQTPWRAKLLFKYIQDRYINPDIIIDITPFWDKKVESISAYKSQFYDPNSKEPQTYISKPDFLNFIEARAIEMGHAIGCTYGEGLVAVQKVGLESIFDLKH